MVEGGCLLPALILLPEKQEKALVDTGIRMETHGGFALGVIDGTERLYLLCPEFQIPTAVVTAWARCGHCDEPLTQLGPIQQEPQYYTVDLLSRL